MSRITERTGNMYRTSGMHNGRRAGSGCLEDDYSETSGGKMVWESVKVRLPNDKVKPESLNGPVICYKAGERK